MTEDAVIRKLRHEAQKKANTAERLFMKHDNHEDMKAMETWYAVVNWLDEKLN